MDNPKETQAGSLDILVISKPETEGTSCICHNQAEKNQCESSAQQGEGSPSIVVGSPTEYNPYDWSHQGANNKDRQNIGLDDE